MKYNRNWVNIYPVNKKKKRKELTTDIIGIVLAGIMMFIVMLVAVYN